MKAENENKEKNYNVFLIILKLHVSFFMNSLQLFSHSLAMR